MASHVQRTLASLRKSGREAGVVERWIQQANKRIDLFGFIDLVSLDPHSGSIVAVQVCAASSLAAHRKKITGECGHLSRAWLECGGIIELWGWRKQKIKRGGTAYRWIPVVEQIQYQDGWQINRLDKS